MSKITLDHLGKEFKSKSAMCESYGIDRITYTRRLGRGWSQEKALTAPAEDKYNGELGKSTPEEREAWKKAYDADHKEERSTYNKKYNADHKEERSTCNKKYNADHKEERSAYGKAYRDDHKEESKAYRDDHKEERSAYDKARKNEKAIANKI